MLYQEQYIEPVSVNKKPYDVLVHQLLSIVKGSSGVSLSMLLQNISENSAFSNISREETEDIIHYLTDIEFFEKLGNELIIGIEGEEVVNHKDFYSLFESPVFFKVSSNGVKIGELPLSPQIRENENIYLSAKIWSIKDIDYQTRKIEVVPAKDGKKPKFFGDAADTAHQIREKMLEILISKEQYSFLDETAQHIIALLRSEFSAFIFNDFEKERSLKDHNGRLTFYSFTSSKINRTLKLILDSMDIETTLDDKSSSFETGTLTSDELKAILCTQDISQNTDEIVADLIRNIPGIINFSKWGKHLPASYQIKLLKEKYFDFEGCQNYLRNLKIIMNP